MEINTELWNLEEQYNGNICNGPFLFPKTADYNSLRYLISLGFQCVVKDPSHDVFGDWLFLRSIEMLEEYKDWNLLPLAKSSREDIIRIFQLQQILTVDND